MYFHVPHAPTYIRAYSIIICKYTECTVNLLRTKKLEGHTKPVLLVRGTSVLLILVNIVYISQRLSGVCIQHSVCTHYIQMYVLRIRMYICM